MVFSDSIFLFFFLPIVLLVYFLLRGRTARNLLLTFMSLIFYAWGEPVFVLTMLLSITVNWLGGLGVGWPGASEKRRKWALTLAVIFNLGLLGVYKYLMFIMSNLNWAFGLGWPVPKIALPIGISFFTFQAMSYVIDVYRGNGAMQKNFFNVCLYVSFFPQLIAGPIVRYETVAAEIEERHENPDEFAAGCRRFLIGLCKKVLLANTLAMLADDAFALPAGELSTAAAWLGAFAYHWQVYFDFSGYSDMAIGMGWMFGFHFLENFNYPMMSRSITEFWRRWHISLGTWFRDYLFFPMGGSRVKKGRAIFNMFVVWALTGLWHGAAWTFLMWGLGFFVLLVIEKYTPFGKWIGKRPLGYLYTTAMVLTVTVLIKAATLPQAGRFIAAMYGAAGRGFWDATATMYVREYGWFVLAGVVASLPVGPFIRRTLRISDNAMQVLGGIGLLAAFVLALSYVVMGGYNPFIYFNF
ncbi:MBOAT family O-acyltransferase [Bacillota bacterium Meth-B3]